jgi:hypothetical protein
MKFGRCEVEKMRSKWAKCIGNFDLPIFSSSKLLFCLACALSFAFPPSILAQGVEAPPVTSFRPDTSLPKVNVPEFVITGKAQTDVARFNKESTEIDSSYFQDKALAGLSMDFPINRSLSLRSSSGQPANLFARISTGSYATTSYLLSGTGGIGDARLNGSLNGNYSSGYTPQTIQRDIAVRAGVSKDMQFGESATTNNSAEIGYSRASYFLYGTGIPDFLRTSNQFNLGLRSDMTFGNFPLTAGLNFDRFSVQDYWKDVQSAVDLNLGTIFQLQSGNIGINGNFHFGNHGTTPPSGQSLSISGIDKSFYDLTLGADYNNSVGDLSYTVGLNYFQYADDSSGGIAKLYPDLRGTYRVNDRVSLFTRFYGKVGDPALSTFFTHNLYIDANFPLRNSQDYANFTLGGNWLATDEISITPEFNIAASRFYPIFVTFPMAIVGTDTSHADNQLLYADRATIFTASVTANYRKDKFGADATLNVRNGKADSLSSIPNLAPFDLTVGGSYQITPQFNFRAYVFILSGRYSDLALKNKLNSVWLLNFHLTYDLDLGRIPVEIFADGRNVFDQKYYIWQGYQEFPIGLFVGVSCKIL